MNPDAVETAPAEEKVGAGARAFVQSLRVLFFVLRILIVVVLGWLVFGGFFYVKEDEEAMVFRFGELVTRDGSKILTSGKWYWAWPYPIEAVKRIQAQRSVTLETTQFWPKIQPNKVEGQSEEAPADPGDPSAALKPGEGGYLVTGDANIMHMIWTITYRVTDAERYYLGLLQDDAPPPKDDVTRLARPDPEAEKKKEEEKKATPPGAKKKTAPIKRGVEKIIESVFANAILDEVARWRVEDVYVLSRRIGEAGPGAPGQGTQKIVVREMLRDAVVDRLNRRLAELDLGISVQAVSITERQPPTAVADAFRAFNDAAVSKSVSAPEGLRPVAILSIGYPAESPDPTPRRGADKKAGEKCAGSAPPRAPPLPTPSWVRCLGGVSREMMRTVPGRPRFDVVAHTSGRGSSAPARKLRAAAYHWRQQRSAPGGVAVGALRRFREGLPQGRHRRAG